MFDQQRGRVPLLVLIALTVISFVYQSSADRVSEVFALHLHYAQNLVDGGGLASSPEQRFQRFLSPLGVLVTAASYVAAGKGSPGAVLLVFRAFSLAALIGAGVVGFRAVTSSSSGPVTAWVFALLYALSARIVGYAANGTEAAFLVLLVAWAIRSWRSTNPRGWLYRGLAWGGLLWAQADGWAFVAALAIAEAALVDGGRRRCLTSLGRSLAVALVVALPWLMVAANTYDSILPPALAADLAGPEAGRSVGKVLNQLYSRLPFQAAGVFGPATFLPGQISPRGLSWFCHVVGFACLVYWLLGSSGGMAKAASLGFFLLCLYQSYLDTQRPWLDAPLALCGLVVLASALGDLATRRPYGSIGAVLILAGLVAGEFSVMAVTPQQMLGRYEPMPPEERGSVLVRATC